MAKQKQRLSAEERYLQYNYRSEIDAKPPIGAIRSAGYTYLVAGAVSAASSYFLPVAPLAQVAIAPVAVFLAWRRFSQRRAIFEDFESINDRRGFYYDDNKIPVAKNEKGEPYLDEQYPHWDILGVPHIVQRVEVSVKEGSRRYVYRKIMAEGYRSAVEARAQWLERYHKPIFDLVEDWFVKAFVLPAIQRKYPHLTNDQIRAYIKGDNAALREVSGNDWKEAFLNHEVEMHEGYAVACVRERWRLDDDRPSALPYTNLRKLLLHHSERYSEQVDLSAIPPCPHPQGDRLSRFYIGHGFMWDVKHTERWDNHRARNLGDVSLDSEDQGDPRIFACGLEGDDKDEVMDIFIRERDTNVGTKVVGTTGVGKTRNLETQIVQAINNGDPVVIMDPKGDPDLVSRVYSAARAAGRGQDVHFFSLASPRNPEVSTYNPLFNYNDPSDMGARVGEVLPDTKDPFWKNAGVATAKVVTVACHWMRELLELFNRNSDGSKVESDTAVPKIFYALQTLAHNIRDPREAERLVDDFLSKVGNPNWQPANEIERDFLAIYRESLYTPVAWTPTMAAVERWGISSPAVMLGWILKIAYLHLYSVDEEMAPPSYPARCDERMIISTSGATKRPGSGGKSMFQLYQDEPDHPVAFPWTPNTGPSADHVVLQAIVSFYRHFVPVEEAEFDEAKTIFDGVCDAINGMQGIAKKDSKQHDNHMSTLRATLTRYSGARERIINAQNPHIQWQRVLESNGIVYCFYASLIDEVASEAIGKVMISDIVSTMGRRYAFSPKSKLKPWWLFVDEVGQLMTTSLIKLANQGRGSGMRLVWAAQVHADIQAALGDASKAEQAQGNVNTTIQYRSSLPGDAKRFAELASQASIVKTKRSVKVTPGYGGGGNQLVSKFSKNDDMSFDEQKTQKVPEDAILNLPRGQAFIHSMGRTYLCTLGLMSEPEVDILEQFWIREREDGVNADPLTRMADYNEVSTIIDQAIRLDSELETVDPNAMYVGVQGPRQTLRPDSTNIGQSSRSSPPPSSSSRSGASAPVQIDNPTSLGFGARQQQKTDYLFADEEFDDV